MNEPRRRFQFGLRRMLLCTAAVAVWLGILKMFGAGPVSFIALTCSAVIVGIVRTVVRRIAVFALSAVTGGILGTLWFRLFGPHMSFFVKHETVAVGLGMLTGIFVFCFVEVALGVVNHLDKPTQTKTDGSAS